MSDQGGGGTAPRRFNTTGNRNSLWDTYRTGLLVELDHSSLAPEEKATVLALLDPTASSQNWDALYEAELRLARARDDVTGKADWLRASAEASDLGIKSLAVLKTEFDLATGTPESRRAVYVRLLEELHFAYTKRRLDRQKRKETAVWLNWFGLTFGLIGFAIALIVYFIFAQNTLETTYAKNTGFVVVALWFGALGAYFSRSFTMNSSIASLGYDALLSEYSTWSVIQRMIIGAIAALIVYFMITGQLIAGDIFPTSDFCVAKDDSPAGAAPCGVDFKSLAKLIVWSFIAGFAERMLPEQLEKYAGSFASTTPGQAITQVQPPAPGQPQ